MADRELANAHQQLSLYQKELERVQIQANEQMTNERLEELNQELEAEKERETVLKQTLKKLRKEQFVQEREIKTLSQPNKTVNFNSQNEKIRLLKEKVM